MSKSFVTCAACYDLVHAKSAASADLWLDLCGLCIVKGEICSVKGEDLPEIRLLENMKYIVTTESPNRITIQIKGLMKTDDGTDFFCIKGGVHD